MIGLLLLLAAVRTGPGTRFSDDWPPARYMGNNQTQVHFTTPKKVSEHCDAGDKPPDGLYTEACTDESGEMWLPNPCKYTGEYARLACHELGHLNRWPGDHPN